MTKEIAIEVRDLQKEYHVGDEVVVALHRINLCIPVSYTHLTLPTKA